MKQYFVKNLFSNLIFVLIPVASFMSCACNHHVLDTTITEEANSIVYHGICKDDKDGTVGILNPNRGFRHEVAIDVVENQEDPISGLQNQVRKYSADHVTLAQSYIYLTHLVGQKLTPIHFQTMQSYFDELEKQGLKAVLRFAYERATSGPLSNGPDLQQALKQLDELKPFLEKNKDLILVVQAGVIGLWGEWHSSKHFLENDETAMKSILKKLLEVVPDEKFIQVRQPIFKNLLKDRPELYQRISFHDDFIVIKPHEWDGNIHDGTSEFNQMANESPYLPVDGELPWGSWSFGEDGWIIDGQEVARRLFAHHYTSLSIVHNYKEEDKDYSMKHWQRTPISQDFLKAKHMPMSNNYFKNKDGKTVERTVFDYIRDHLGYRIELQNLKIDGKWEKGKELILDLSLINRGFSTVFGNHQVYFILVSADGKVYEFPTDTNPRTWQPYSPSDVNCSPLTHHIIGRVQLNEDLPTGTYKLGLWMPDSGKDLKYNQKYAIRCANSNATWFLSLDRSYGINLLLDNISIK